jgi:CheY-like chemotaxis protein
MQSTSTCTVLLIEDDPEELVSWSTALRTCASHYAVLEAAGGQEGLALLRNQEVDCVVLDLDLSATSGFQVLLDVVPDRRRPEIAVVILSRLWNPTLAQMALEHGAQAFLLKQHTSIDVLDEAIKNAMTSVAAALAERPKGCSERLPEAP